MNVVNCIGLRLKMNGLYVIHVGLYIHTRYTNQLGRIGIGRGWGLALWPLLVYTQTVERWENTGKTLHTCTQMHGVLQLLNINSDTSLSPDPPSSKIVDPPPK